MPCLFGTLSRQKLGPRYIEVHLSNEEARPQTARQPDLDVVVKVYPLIVGRCRRGSMYVNAIGFFGKSDDCGRCLACLFHRCLESFSNPSTSTTRRKSARIARSEHGLRFKDLIPKKASWPQNLEGLADSCWHHETFFQVYSLRLRSSFYPADLHRFSSQGMDYRIRRMGVRDCSSGSVTQVFYC